MGAGAAAATPAHARSGHRSDPGFVPARSAFRSTGSAARAAQLSAARNLSGAQPFRNKLPRLRPDAQLHLPGPWRLADVAPHAPPGLASGPGGPAAIALPDILSCLWRLLGNEPRVLPWLRLLPDCVTAGQLVVPSHLPA